jgi:TRAP-type transport system periplasmic protein
MSDIGAETRLSVNDPMRKLSILPRRFSRRHFIGGMAAAAAVASTGARAADFRYRLGLSQPLDSPNYIRLKEMADRIRAETAGRMQIDIFAESKLGSDSAMLAMLQKNELEMYMGGNVFGPLVPVTEMPGLPFTFKNSAEVFAALDGELGDHIRAEMLAKGLYAFRYGFDNGFHQLTTSTKPIRTVDDLVGMKIRTPVQKMTVDFFESLGARPMTFTLNRLYEVLKDHTVDAQTDPLQIIVLLKLNEVQTYLSLTNHWWSGFTLVANEHAWQALPPDIQEIISRHAEAAALAQRQDVDRLDAGAVELLRGKGMIVNQADTSGFRKHLGAFYARWKGIYGDKAWALLEARVGKLV